jgi:hypothetical protein
MLTDVSKVSTASIIKAISSQKTKLHTRRRESLKSHIFLFIVVSDFLICKMLRHLAENVLSERSGDVTTLCSPGRRRRRV